MSLKAFGRWGNQLDMAPEFQFDVFLSHSAKDKAVYAISKEFC